MSNENVIETNETPDGEPRYRLRLVMDEYPDEPENDGQSPLMRLENRGAGWRAEHVMVGSRPTGDDTRIEDAAAKWGTPTGKDWPKFEKYLRAYYGVTTIETYSTRDYWYVTYDPDAWREWSGAPAGSVDMSEWQAYCEGEVYGWVIEMRVTWHDVGGQLPDQHTWEEVPEDGSCWGYYGYKWAKEAATEAWQSFLADKGLREPEPETANSDNISSKEN